MTTMILPHDHNDIASGQTLPHVYILVADANYQFHVTAFSIMQKH